jgi:crotonobetainyl-CoA:carnitine CoA-transferase CaiB-like acyl-CoA transferase
MHPKHTHLEGLRVVELAGVLAGPAVGMFFAELGAEVIKVENKRRGGDVTRTWKTPAEDPAEKDSAYYHAVNWGKQIEFRDLNDPDDLDSVVQLIDWADILLVNFKAGDAERYELDVPTLRNRFPRLIIGQITGFPDENRVAFDAVLQAETGLMSLNGALDQGPMKLPVAFIDLFAAHQLKEGILLALFRRSKSNEGAHVKVSLFDSAIASLANQASVFLNTGVPSGRTGSLHPSIAPYGETFYCADGQHMLIACGSDAQFVALCSVLNRNDLTTDSRFKDNPSRVVHRQILQGELGSAFLLENSFELMEKLIRVGIPAGIVRDLPGVFSIPEARKLILEENRNGKSTKRVSTAVFQINPMPCSKAS